MDPFSALSIATSVAQFVEFGCSLVSETRQIYNSLDGATVSQVETSLAAKRLLKLSERMKSSLRDQTLPKPPDLPPILANPPPQPPEESLRDNFGPIKQAESDKKWGNYMAKKAEFERQSEIFSKAKVSQESLCEICDKCILLSKELLAKLNELRFQGPKHRKFKSLLFALKSVWSSEAIASFQKRLERHRRELSDHLLVATCEKLQVLSIEEPIIKLTMDTKFKLLDSNQQQSIDSFRNTLRNVVAEANGELRNELAAQRILLETIQKHSFASDEEEYIRRQRQLDEDANFAILNNLRFATMEERREEIHEAHKTTFSWIFRDPETAGASGNMANTCRPSTNFAHWLRQGEGIYWINGKAGSGKSTLMRYIRETPDTLKHLREWAGSAELRVASFYFWNGGSPEQRSQAGLLRSLLHEILWRRQDLIRNVFEEEWIASRSSEHKPYHMSGQYRFHSVKRLREALAYLVALASDRLKLCFLVDGLDEYEETDLEGPQAIIDVFKTISCSPYVKVCVSSRPRIQYEKAFGTGPTLRLQDLTYNDIRTYVYDKFGSDPQMLQLSTSHSCPTAELVKEILSKANGVFLWVSLAVASLLKGLTYGDEICHLQARLKAIPRSLNRLYEHMLNGIDEHYIDSAYQIFQIFNKASDVDVRPTVLELDIAHNSTYAHAMKTKCDAMSQEDIQKRRDRMLLRLKVWCGGLLEAHDHLDSNWEAKEDTEEMSRNHKPIHRNFEAHKAQGYITKIGADPRVSYLHRTVRDYLKRDSVKAKLEGSTRNSPKTESFDPNLSLLMSYLINLKHSICSFYTNTNTPLALGTRMWRTTNDIFNIAQKVDGTKRADVMALLNEYRRIGWGCWLPEPPYCGHVTLVEAWRDQNLLCTIRFGLCSFVEKSLPEYRKSPDPPGRTILMYALGLSVHLQGCFVLLDQPAFPPMVELLLQHGEDPNQVIDHHTVFEYCLKAYWTESDHALNDVEHYQRWASIITSMLQHGAEIPPRDPAKIPNLSPWEFKENQKIQKNMHSLDILIQDLAAKASPKAAALLRQAHLQQRKPQDQETLSSSGNLSTPKRSRDSLKEPGSPSATYIDLLDDDDGVDSLARPPARAQGLSNRGTTPAKRPRIEIDLT